MADKINVLIPEETVDAKIKEIGEQISKDYAGKEVHLICILKGGVFFACELAKRITVPVSLRRAAYHSSCFLHSTGSVSDQGSRSLQKSTPCSSMCLGISSRRYLK